MKSLLTRDQFFETLEAKSSKKKYYNHTYKKIINIISERINKILNDDKIDYIYICDTMRTINSMSKEEKNRIMRELQEQLEEFEVLFLLET